MKSKRAQAPIQLIAFLGNPGRQYEKTRHNVGWMLADRIVPSESREWKSKFHGVFFRHGDVVLLKPTAYMNNSGRSVEAALSFFSIKPESLLVVHDDLETAFGKVDTAWSGGHRGHNGVRSISTSISTPDYHRLRIGIGRPPSTRPVAGWVLERFARDEEAELPEILDRALVFLPVADT